MMSDSSLGMVPSSMVSARCMSFLASSWRETNSSYAQCSVNAKHTKVHLSRRYLLVSVAEADVECAHGLHNGHDRLQGVAVDDGDELQAFFK